MTRVVELKWGYEIVTRPEGGSVLARDGQVIAKIDGSYYIRHCDSCVIIEFYDEFLPMSYLVTPKFCRQFSGALECVKVSASDAPSGVVFVETDPDGWVRVMDESGNDVLFEQFPDLCPSSVRVEGEVLVVRDACLDETIAKIDLRTLTVL